MYYQLNDYVFISLINNYLKLCDKLHNDDVIGDYNSYLFLKHLDYKPQHIEDVVIGICKEYSPEPLASVVYNDAITLFDEFEKKGYISKGKSETQCAINSKSFLDQRITSDDIFCSQPNNALQVFENDYLQKPAVQGVMVEITKMCNERCVHCYIPHKDKKGDIKRDDFYRIVDECVKLGTVIDFKISGGECMLHPHFKDFIKYVKSNRLALTILTNLTLLDNEILDILKNGTFTKVQVSLFSLNPVIHDSITMINGSLQKTLINLDKLHNLNIPVCIATQIMESNKSSLEDIYQYVEKRNFDLNLDWSIMSQEDGNTENLVNRVNDINYYSTICQTRMKCSKAFKENYKSFLSAPLRSPDSSLCSAGMNFLHIDSNLNVHPCAGWTLSIGNLNDSSIHQIWSTSTILQNIRKITLADFPKCTNCSDRNVCTICMAQAYNENASKEYIVPAYICSMNKVIKKTVESSINA
jgi:MoaA/NifB/PqqE/SkfB family radical SAM enzyme